MTDIKVELNDSRRKNINLKNVDSLSGIKVVRQREPSISSESSFSSDSSYSSEASSESNYKKKTKKILRKKVYPQESKNDYNAFSNPKKTTHREDDDDESEYSNMSESDGGSEASDDPDTEKKDWEERQKLKQSLLIKIQSLEAKGFEFSKKFTMSSNYDDMLFEYEKIKNHLDTQAGIKMARRALMACVTGIEFLNRKFDPFDIKLNGFSY